MQLDSFPLPADFAVLQVEVHCVKIKAQFII